MAHLVEAHVAVDLLPVAFHFRAGVHTGPVYRFWDPGREGWNFTGKGINDGQRVLSAIGADQDDVVFLSSDVRHKIMSLRTAIQPYAGILDSLHNRGRRKDKHGEFRRLYEVNHTRVTQDYLPAGL